MDDNDKLQLLIAEITKLCQRYDYYVDGMFITNGNASEFATLIRSMIDQIRDKIDDVQPGTKIR